MIVDEEAGIDGRGRDQVDLPIAGDVSYGDGARTIVRISTGVGRPEERPIGPKGFDAVAPVDDDLRIAIVGEVSHSRGAEDAAPHGGVGQRVGPENVQPVERVIRVGAQRVSLGSDDLQCSIAGDISQDRYTGPASDGITRHDVALVVEDVERIFGCGDHDLRMGVIVEVADCGTSPAEEASAVAAEGSDALLVPQYGAIIAEGVRAIVAADDDLGCAVSGQVGKRRFGGYAHQVRAPEDGGTVAGVGPIATIDVEPTVDAGSHELHVAVPVQVADGDRRQEAGAEGGLELLLG